MWLQLLGAFLPKIFTGVEGYLSKRQEHKNRIQEAKVNAKIALIEQKTKMIADADVESVKAQKNSIKDEFVVLAIFMPYICAFIPGLQEYIQQGFVIIGSLPHWYQVAIIGIVISVMGLRFMFKKFWRK